MAQSEDVLDPAPGKAQEPAAVPAKDSASKDKGQDKAPGKAGEDPLAGLELKKNSEGPMLNAPLTSTPAEDPFRETKPKLEPLKK